MASWLVVPRLLPLYIHLLDCRCHCCGLIFLTLLCRSQELDEIKKHYEYDAEDESYPEGEEGEGEDMGEEGEEGDEPAEEGEEDSA